MFEAQEKNSKRFIQIVDTQFLQYYSLLVLKKNWYKNKKKIAKKQRGHLNHIAAERSYLNIIVFPVVVINFTPKRFELICRFTYSVNC